MRIKEVKRREKRKEEGSMKERRGLFKHTGDGTALLLKEALIGYLYIYIGLHQLTVTFRVQKELAHTVVSIFLWYSFSFVSNPQSSVLSYPGIVLSSLQSSC